MLALITNFVSLNSAGYCFGSSVTTVELAFSHKLHHMLLRLIGYLCFISFTLMILQDFTCSAEGLHHDLERQWAIEAFKERMRHDLPTTDNVFPFGEEETVRKRPGTENPAEAFKKLPFALRSKLEKEVNDMNTIHQEPEVEDSRRELAIRGQPEYYKHLEYGLQPGFHLTIPDYVPPERIVRAIIYFHEFTLPPEKADKDKHFYLLYYPEGGAQVAIRLNSSLKNQSIDLYSYDSVSIGVYLENFLFQSINIESQFKLRFFFAYGAKNHYTILQLPLMPALHLNYDIASPHKVRHTSGNQPTECPADERTKCCLVRSTVTIHELGWTDSVSFPVKFEFNWCRGFCVSHWDSENAFIRIRLKAHHPETIRGAKEEAFSPCCTGIRYAPVTLLRTKSNGATERHTLHKATVLECGCL